MKIILVRHGKPSFDLRTKISAKALAESLEAYDLAGIENASHPSPELHELIQKPSMIFTSDLPRSLESAARLSTKANTSSPLFREIPAPSYIPYPFPLRVITWAVLGRILWYLGYSGKIETRTKARARANKAAEQLIQYASDDGAVVLIGHGLMNMFIAKSLQQQGWHSPSPTTRHHWSWAEFEPRSLS